MTELLLLGMTVGVAHYYDLDPDLFTRLVYAESRYDPQAVNGQSVGLCQINLGAWPLEDWVVKTDDPYEPYANLMMGGHILSLMLEREVDRLQAVAAYTLGHGRLEELVSVYRKDWLGVLDLPTFDYVGFIVFNHQGTRFGAWSWRDAIPAPEVRSGGARMRTPR